MNRPKLADRIKQGVFLLDGAMGTQLIARGVQPGTCNDALNVESPEIVQAVHGAYFEVGSDAVLTNTFGANRYSLARHRCTHEAFRVNVGGASLARAVAAEDRYVLGDIGPTGDFLEPLGALRAEEVRDAFVEQAEGLLAGGADGFIIETMTALDEVTIAIEAVKSVGGALPVLASMAFDRGTAGFRTMMGVDVCTAVSKMLSLGVDAVGFNCGVASLDDYVELAKAYVAAVRSVRSEALVFAEPNAGKPELVDSRAVYSVTPEEFADACRRIHDVGVHVLGGCCGTGPAHIAAVAGALKA